MIIVFSGIDCAGKSTQIDLIKKSIFKQGISVNCLWVRGGYTSGFEFLKKIIRFILGTNLAPSGKNTKRDKMISNSLIKRLWLSLAILDLLITFFLIRIKSLLGQIIICDRYIGDTFIDFSLNFPNSNFEKTWLWKLLMITAPRPNLGFLFILPVDESMYRSKLKNEPFPDAEEVLRMRLEIYLTSKFFMGQGWSKIDGLESINSIAIQIKDIVFSKIINSNAT